MRISLPAESRLITRIYAPLAYLEAFEPEDWPRRAVPDALLGPTAQQPTGLTVRSLRTDVQRECSVPGQDLALVSSCVELVALAGRIAFVEIAWEWRAIADAQLAMEDVPTHWGLWYEQFPALEDEVFAGSRLEGMHSMWQFPVSVIIGAASADTSLAKAAGEAVGPSGATVDAAGIQGAASWDGAVFFLAADAEADVQCDAIAFLIRSICADWEFHEEALEVSRRELIADTSLSQRLASIRRALRRIHTSLAIVDPASLCYQESHRGLLRCMWEGWERGDLHARTTATIDRVHQLHELDVGLERAEVARREEARGDVLNRIVAWLGLLGVASTVAGILSTVDYEDEVLDKVARVALIGGTTAITVVAFGALLWRAVRVSVGNIELVRRGDDERD